MVSEYKITLAEDYISTVANYMTAEMSEETMSHQAKTTMKHIPNASPALKKAAKDIKPGVGGYRDRIAMLKAGGVKEEVDQIDELSSDLLGRYKTAAGADASKADKAGDYNKGNKRFGGIVKATKKQFSNDMKKEEVVQEGRPSQRHPLEGHEYHKKTNAELEYIAKDAHKAAEAMKSHNTTAENKYRDQANDSATVRHFRKTSGNA
jgi:hypothetical protein